MSEAVKHTPGPWSWHGDELLSPAEFVMGTAKGNRPIDNDARLIATAPEMLEAAELALEGIEVIDLLIASIEKHGNYSVESTLGFLNQARCAKLRLTEAISKATGGSHDKE